jgi:hypothetical protein
MFGVPLGISFSEIYAYGRLSAFSMEDMDEFAHFISVLDAYYFEWRAENGKT